jgi:drug/metabolite transporter (DMT)-like permease
MSDLTLKKVAAFSAVYLFWGTTYLAIRLAIETIPPFSMAGIRFSLAGGLFFIWCYLRTRNLPSLVDWKKAAIPGILMFVTGNGLLTWSELFVPSGFAALIIATIPIWMVSLHWFFSDGKRPKPIIMIGIALGLAGVVLLMGVDHQNFKSLQKGGSTILYTLILLFAAISWASGSLYTRKVKMSVDLPMTISMQILIGGLILLMIGFIIGEWSEMAVPEISLMSVTAIVYLILFGSILTYSAYVWLLRVSTPARVGTYAFFNPLVAVILGWLILDEPITLQTVFGAFLILLSILLIIQLRLRKKSDLQ